MLENWVIAKLLGMYLYRSLYSMWHYYREEVILVVVGALRSRLSYLGCSLLARDASGLAREPKLNFVGSQPIYRFVGLPTCIPTLGHVHWVYTALYERNIL